MSVHRPQSPIAAPLRRLVVFVAALSVAIPPPPARLASATEPSSVQSFATTQIDPRVQAALERKGELVLRNTPLRDALLSISETWDINIVVNETVEGEVNGVFRDTPLREILDAVLDANGLTYHPVGPSLVVKQRGGRDEINPFFQSATISMGVAKPEEVLEGAKLLASPQGHVQAIPSANSLVVFDHPDRINVIRRYVAQLDSAARHVASESASGLANLETMIFAPQYIDAKSLENVVRSLISQDGKIGLMELENRLVVFDYSSNLTRIAETVRRVDVPRPQVRITALIYDLSIEDIERLGINWSSAGKWSRDAAGAA
ncbi:MAG: hypothetical protein KDA41_21895, partial [Planctomycetales bacterium]|nr:hypothetical protein [Planctomycetales bacterium]